MKMNKIIGTSLLGASLLGLGACGSSLSAPSHQKQQLSTSNQSNGGNGNASSKSDRSQNKDTQSSQNQPSKQNKDSVQNEGTKQNDGANQGGTAKQTEGSNSTDQKSKPTPTSMKEVAAALNTRVPLMLPSDVPVTNGNNLSATTKSGTWYYRTQLNETDHPTKINSQAAFQGTPIANIQGTEYKNDAEAQDQINGYLQVHPAQHPEMSIDLGHGNKGVADAGAGHSYITWNEGRWCLKIDSPNDPKYKTKKYHDSKKLARKMVSYLEDHALPAPQRIGVVSVNNWNNGMQTTIKWQYHEMTYKVTSKDPFQALKIAVQMSFQK